MLKTLFKSLQGTDWETLTDFVSPAFFDVVSPLGMAGTIAGLIKDYTNKPRHLEAIASANAKIAKPLHLTISAPDSTTESRKLSELSTEEKLELGERVLEVYFAQIFHCDTTLLDLRSTAFASAQHWLPRPLFYRWDKQFRIAIQDMYRGFYQNDTPQYTRGLKCLNLEHAADIFRSHFGAGSQECVSFRLSEFKKSFHAIFMSCKAQKTKLHPDFFALGIYLVCLYEHLELLELPFNVRRSFQKANDLK